MAHTRSPRAVDVHVAYRIRAARQMRGITQKKLARQLGLSFQQVQKNEKGSNRISAGRLYQVAISMKLPIMFFFEGINEDGTMDPVRTRAERFLGTRDGVVIASAFPLLRKRTRRAILDLIKDGARQKN